MGLLQSFRAWQSGRAVNKSLNLKNPQLAFLIDAMTGGRNSIEGREYAAHIWVYRAANIWGGACRCPIVGYTPKRNGDEDAADLPFILRSPNADESFDELAELAFIHLAIDGRAMMLVDDGEWQGRGEPTSIRLVAPGAMRLDRDDVDYLGRIRNWRLRVGGVERNIAPESVVYVRLPSPYKMGMWQSPIDALRDTVDADAAARRHNSYLMRQHGRIPGVISYDDDLTEDELRRRSSLFHELYGSAEAAGKWLHVVKTKVQQMSVSPKDMDWEAGLRLFREEVASAYNIPPVMAGILDKATYSNFEQADRALVESCLMPLQSRMVNAINKQLLERAGINVRIRYDAENYYAALQESEKDRYEKYERLVKNLVTPEQAAKLTGVDLGDVNDAHRILWTPTSLVPAIVPDTQDAAPSASPVSGPVQDQALNGAQVSSLLEILDKISSGSLTPEGAVAVIMVAFPTVDESEARKIVAGAIKQAMPEQAAKLLAGAVTRAEKDKTNFPKSGDDKKVSLSNSNFSQFDYAYALDIRENHPDVWSKGGNIRGNSAFTNWGKAREGSDSDAILDWIREREAWAARHNDNKNIEGVVALMKWGVVGSIGMAQMKSVINGAKKKSAGEDARTEALRSAVWRAQMSRRLPYEKRMQKAAKKYLFDLRVAALSNLDGLIAGAKSVSGRALPGSGEIAAKLIDSGWDRELVERMTPIMLAAGTAAAMRLLEDLKLGADAFSEAAVTELIRGQSVLLPRVNENTRDALAKSAQELIDAVGQGENIDDVADRLRSTVRDVFAGSEARATTIARTEIGRAMEGARFVQLKQAGVATKVWISSRDTEVRDLHRSIDGEEVPVDQPFSNGLMYPMDPAGSAAQTVNCRCTAETGSFE